MAGLVDRFTLGQASRALSTGRATRPGKSVKLTSRFPGIGTSIARRLSTEMRHTAQLIAEEAESRLNVGPPDIHLMEHLHVVREAPATYAVIAGDEEAFYGHIVEHGGLHSAPRPFLVPALDAQKADAVARATAILRGL